MKHLNVGLNYGFFVLSHFIPITTHAVPSLKIWLITISFVFKKFPKIFFTDMKSQNTLMSVKKYNLTVTVSHEFPTGIKFSPATPKFFPMGIFSI